MTAAAACCPAAGRRIANKTSDLTMPLPSVQVWTGKGEQRGKRAGMNRFPSRMFRWAAIYGVIVLTPLLFAPLGADRPESQFGFVGLALVFQAVFWIIGGDPLKYRALMLPSVGEKLVFGVPTLVLWSQGRTQPVVAAFGAIDLLLGLGFLIAWLQVRRAA